MSDIQQQNPSLASLSTVEQARDELEFRLNGIHNDLQLTQTIGLLFVKRQEDLKNCFDQLQLLKGSNSHTAGSTLSLHQEYEDSAVDDSFSLSAPQQHQPLPQSLREQLALIDKEFQEGQNGILGLKGMIDAQLVRPFLKYFLESNNHISCEPLYLFAGCPTVMPCLIYILPVPSLS